MYIHYIWDALREQVPNVLSRYHTKRRTGARGRARASFGMTPTYQKKIILQKILKSQCHTKRRTGVRGRASPSFGMTLTF